LFAYYVEKLRSISDGEGSLLDHVTIIYGSGMSDGNTHNHHNLPTVLIGSGAGRIQGGRHLKYPPYTPVTNLFLSVLDKLGVPAETIGDSTGKVDLLSSL